MIKKTIIDAARTQGILRTEKLIKYDEEMNRQIEEKILANEENNIKSQVDDLFTLQ